MDRLQVVFGRSYGLISLSIQARTRCMWSHIGIVLPCGTLVLEARGGVGVVVTPLHEFKARYCEIAFRTLPCVSLEKALAYAHSRKGLKFDSAACWGMALGRDWSDKGAEHCAKLVAASTGLVPEEFLNTTRPKDLWRLSASPSGEVLNG